ncbi:MAG: NYN domain-containing protein [Vicinamibacterales bacterium]
MSDERLKIAVFIDFDNIEIGVKNTLGLGFDIGAVLEAIKERGEIITKVAYGDWKRGDYGRAMSNHAVRLVQRVMTPGGDKNGADINLALDALEMAFTHDHINAFVIVGGDSDFITLVEKLKQYDKKVFVVGGRQFTSQVMQKNCTEFIAYENVARSTPRVAADRSRPAGVGQAMNIDGVVPLVRRALKVLADREVTPQLGLLKSTLLQLDSSFSERDYGVTSFRDFAEKLAEKGIVLLKHTGRSTLVELSESGAAMADAIVTAGEAAAAAGAAPVPAVEGAPAPPPAPARGPRELDAATQAAIQEGVELVRALLADPPQPPRWPMYLRQIKQFIRASHPDFDDRKYGSIVDLMRACQKEGLVKLERDRQGGLRVFGAGGASSASPSLAQASAETEGPPAAPPSSANVYRPKSVTLGWVIGDDDEKDGDDSGESQDAALDDVPVQIAPIVPDDLEPEDDQSKFFAPGSAKEPISAGPAARGVKRGPRRTMSAEDAAERPKRARKTTTGTRRAPARRKPKG